MVPEISPKGTGFVGQLPQDWVIVSMDKACSKVTDGTHATPETQVGGRPYITAIHVKSGKIDFEKCLFLSEEDHREIYKRCDPKRGDLAVVNIGAGVGECGYVDVDFEFSMKNVALLKPDPDHLDTYFLFQIHRFRQDRIAHSIKSGGAQPFLSLKDLRKLPILLPPLPEQRKIADILSTWDQAIENTEALLSNARSQKRALMQQLLTGKRRFPAFKGQPWKEVRLGEAEEQGWLKLNRGKVISKKDIAAFPGDHPIYSSSVVGNGEFGRYAEHMFDEELITWSVDGGGHFFHRKKHKFSVTNVCGWMRVDTDVLNYAFMASQLQFLHQRLQFDYQSKAHPSVIRNIYDIVIPSLDEQKAIGRVALECDDEITLLQNETNRLRTEKKALMQQLLTGKRRVVV